MSQCKNTNFLSKIETFFKKDRWDMGGTWDSPLSHMEDSSIWKKHFGNRGKNPAGNSRSTHE